MTDACDSSDPAGSDDGDGDSGGWPVALRGVTESVVTTPGPDGGWNVAALGLHAGDPVTARTYGRTRTWRNFRERGEGYVQFTRDPREFVGAALDTVTLEEPLLDGADAWARVVVERCGVADEDGGEVAGETGTRVVTWALRPADAGVERRTVPTTNRGYYAVVEATVAASRLDVDAFDRGTLLDRLAYFERVVETCGGEADRAAFGRIHELVDAEW